MRAAGPSEQETKQGSHTHISFFWNREFEVFKLDTVANYHWHSIPLRLGILIPESKRRKTTARSYRVFCDQTNKFYNLIAVKFPSWQGRAPAVSPDIPVCRWMVLSGTSCSLILSAGQFPHRKRQGWEKLNKLVNRISWDEKGAGVENSEKVC